MPSMAAVLAFSIRAVVSRGGGPQNAFAAIVFPADRGSATIDVSKYPEVQQQDYKLFLAKCSTCHTTARAVNASYVLPKEWKSCVARMQKMPGAGINASMAKRIAAFLSYDSAARKKDLLDKKAPAEKSGAKAAAE